MDACRVKYSQAYDRAALVLRGVNADINFASTCYHDDAALKYLRAYQKQNNTTLSKDDIIKHLRLFQKESARRLNTLKLAAEAKSRWGNTRPKSLEAAAKVMDEDEGHARPQVRDAGEPVASAPPPSPPVQELGGSEAEAAAGTAAINTSCAVARKSSESPPAAGVVAAVL